MKNHIISRWLSTFTFLASSIILQLYFNKDHYFAMNRAKCSFTMIVLISSIVTITARVFEQIWNKQERQQMTLLDWCVFVFGFSSIITCILSQAPELTLVGTKGMFVGSFSYLTGMLTYFVVSRNMVPNKRIIAVLILGWAMIFMWTILNQCGVDLFGMHNDMRLDQRYGYVSSMGNTNSACDAFSTMVPFLLILFLMSNKSINKHLLYIISFIGLLAVYTLRDEGVLIGLLLMMPFVVISALSDYRKVKKAIQVLFLVGISLTFYHLICLCSVVKSPHGLIYKISSFCVGEIISVSSLLLFYLQEHIILNFNNRLLRISRIVISWMCVTVLIAFVIISIVKSFYDPDYGSTRGAIWKGCVWSFRLYNPAEMIFGQGSGMFSKNVTLAFSMLFNKEAPYTYATCHNSLLQALLGNGIIGLLCLLTGVYALLRDWFRDLRHIVLRPMSKYESIRNVEFNEVIRVASFVAIMGYFGASLVESTYPHTVMLLFAMLALYRSSYFVPRKKKEKQPAEQDM